MDPAIGTISSTPDDILDGVNSQMCLTRRLASRQLSNSTIQAENTDKTINTFLQNIVQRRNHSSKQALIRCLYPSLGEPSLKVH